jgi:hypothetical protein
VDEAVDPVFAQPLGARAAQLFLTSRWAGPLRRRISSFCRQAIPAIAILHERLSMRAAWVMRGDQAMSRLGLGTSRGALESLEEQIRALQAQTGGWLWSVLGTSLNLLALRALGKDAKDPAVRRGLDFIHRLRTAHRGGAPKQSWCNAELWDSSVCGATLTFCGVSPEALRADRLVPALLEQQQRDGLWAFGLGAIEGDNDSTSMVLAFLCRTARALPGPLANEVTLAVRRCVRTLLAAQQADGGWGYSPPPCRAPYSFGARSPFGLETVVVDASTADVTGRILAALLTARASGALEAQDAHALSRAWDRAVAYFKRAQSPLGSWQGRWTAGYLSPLVFVLPALRAGGQAMSLPWIERARAFVQRTQRADGGWGESPRADSAPQDAGHAPSTPVQTGYALAALIATAPDKLREKEPSIARALEYLLESEEGGAWQNHRALYTVAFRDDYFDAPLMTQALVLLSLRLLQRARKAGPAAAVAECILGKQAGSSRIARVRRSG